MVFVDHTKPDPDRAKKAKQKKEIEEGLARYKEKYGPINQTYVPMAPDRRKELRPGETGQLVERHHYTPRITEKKREENRKEYLRRKELDSPQDKDYRRSEYTNAPTASRGRSTWEGRSATPSMFEIGQGERNDRNRESKRFPTKRKFDPYSI